MIGSMLLNAILSAFVPAAIESGKQYVQAKLGGVRATTVDEQIKLDQNEVAKLEAVAKLDNPGGTPSQWVIDLRGSARYIAAILSILTGISAQFIPGLDVTIKLTALDISSVAFGFLFGTRIVAHIKK